jgi:U3 small nucleolar RNA-associated protein 14
MSKSSTKPSSKNAQNLNKKTTKPTTQRKKPQPQFDNESDDDFFVDGEYDFSSDVEVMDLSAMLDEPEERVKNVRAGGQNKALKPKKRSKKLPSEKIARDDEDVDSEEDITTLDDFITKDTSSEPQSINHTKQSKSVQKVAPKVAPIEEEDDDGSDIIDDDMEMIDGEDDEDMEGDEDVEDEEMEDDEIHLNKNKKDSIFSHFQNAEFQSSDDENSENDSNSDPDSTKPSALSEYLSRFEKKTQEDEKTDKPAQPSKVEQLRELARTQRRKGELFSSTEQIGVDSVEVGLSNLQTAVSKLEQNNTSSKSLSVSSLLASLKAAPTKSSSLSTSSMLESLRAPSLKKLEQQTDFVLERQTKALESRMGDVERGRLERGQFYTDKSKDISKYQGIIQHNLGVQTLDLTKQQRPMKVNVVTSGAIVDNFTATNDLEADLENIMNLVGRDQSKKAQIEYQKQLIGMKRDQSVEQLAEQAKYLSKMKLNAYFEQQRAARIAKIKSRAQRKYIRLQEEKVKRQKLEAGLKGEEGGLSEEQLEEMQLQFEKQRVRERALLSHRNTSQWAKRQLRIAGKDKNARQLLQEQLDLGQQLRQKLGHKKDEDGFAYNNDDDSGESDIGSDDDEDTVMRKQLDKLTIKKSKDDEDDLVDQKKVKGSALFNLPFMKRAEDELKRKNDESIEQLRREYGLKQDLDSDDDTYSNRDKMDKKMKEFQNDPQSVSVLQTKQSQLKKTYGPQSNHPITGVSGDLSVVKDDDGQTTGSVEASSGKKRMASMFGGLFDLDDNELLNVDKDDDNDIATGNNALSLHQQQAQRDKILQNMRAMSGKAPLALQKPTIVDINSMDNDIEEESNTTAKLNKMGNIIDNHNDDDGDDDGDDDDNSEEEEANPWLVQAKQPSKSKSKSETRLNLTSSILLVDSTSNNPPQSTQKNTKSTKNTNTKPSDPAVKQTDLVSLAFTAANDQNDDFEKMKLQEMEDELPQFDTTDSVAGWGSWAGVEKSQRQIQRENTAKAKKIATIQAQRDAIMSTRTDAHLRNVIISAKKDTQALKYQMSSVPHPYTSMEEYQAALRIPLGREWNTAQGFKELNKPKMIVNTGQVIQPMKWNKSFAGYDKRGEAKKTAKNRSGGDDDDDDIEALKKHEEEERKKKLKTRKFDHNNDDKKIVKRQRVKK